MGIESLGLTAIARIFSASGVVACQGIRNPVYRVRVLHFRAGTGPALPAGSGLRLRRAGCGIKGTSVQVMSSGVRASKGTRR